MPAESTRSDRTHAERIVSAAGWLAAGGLLFIAALWASEPGGAHAPASSWKAGSTVTTWDWERHWNYWMQWVCAEKRFLPGVLDVECIKWSKVGPIWKPCGSEIRPPDPSRINSCGIGQVGGHDPHGDDLDEKYTYLGRHEDRTGPTYAVCEGDPGLPADTSPGNCGTWVTEVHDHCPGDGAAHPPDCPSSTSGTSSTTSTSTTRPSTTSRPSTTTTTEPPTDPWACYETEVDDALYDALQDRSRPGLGLRPSAHGYVGVPMEVSYTGDSVDSFSVRVGRDRVYVRMWVSRVSWSFTDLGTLDGVSLGNRTYYRHAPARNSVWLLRSPTTVSVAGETVVYRRSSFRSGYETGYPVVLRVTWTVECRQRGVAGWVELGEENRGYRHTYKVYAIRSRPG